MATAASSTVAVFTDHDLPVTCDFFAFCPAKTGNLGAVSSPPWVPLLYKNYCNSY